MILVTFRIFLLFLAGIFSEAFKKRFQIADKTTELVYAVDRKLVRTIKALSKYYSNTSTQLT